MHLNSIECSRYFPQGKGENHFACHSKPCINLCSSIVLINCLHFTLYMRQKETVEIVDVTVTVHNVLSYDKFVKKS